MSSLLKEFWLVVTFLSVILWFAVPYALNFLMWSAQVAPNDVASNWSKWAAWLARWMVDRRVRQGGIGVLMILMFLAGIGFANWRRPPAVQSTAPSADTAQATVAKCADVDVWMPPVEAINAFVPEKRDFYELLKTLESLKKSSIELDNQINKNPNSPELDTWKKRQYDIQGKLSQAREKRFRIQSPVLEKLVEQLKNGALVAKAYDRHKRELSCITTDLWQSLRFELNEEEFNKAGGAGMHYTGVLIGKAK